MNAFTKFSVIMLILSIVGFGEISAQIRWNPTEWESNSNNPTAVYTVVDNKVRVTNLGTSGSNFRDDFRHNKGYTLLKSEPVIALQIKGINSTYRSGDRKIEILYQTNVDNVQTVNFSLNSGTQTPTKSLDLDGDGIQETFLWDLDVRMGAKFSQDTIVPYLTTWTPNQQNGTRAWLKFVAIFEPAEGATQETVGYDILHLGTYASEAAAQDYLVGLMTDSKQVLQRTDLYFNSNNGMLTIHSNQVKEIDIYGIDGRIVKQKYSINEGANRIDFLNKGIYIIENQKVVVN